MTLDDYISVFREELADLHWEERRDLNGVLSLRNAREIFRVMEELRETMFFASNDTSNTY